MFGFFLALGIFGFLLLLVAAAFHASESAVNIADRAAHEREGVLARTNEVRTR